MLQAKNRDEEAQENPTAPGVLFCPSQLTATLTKTIHSRHTGQEFSHMICVTTEHTALYCRRYIVSEVCVLCV